MTQTPFILQGEMLTYRQDGQNIQVVVDTAGWYTWLETASTFTFHSEHGSFTARKERAGNKRGGQYWRAYRKRHGKLHRAYLGKSEELTLERLKVVATVLARQGSADTTKANAHGSGGTILQSSEEPQDGQVSFLSAPTTVFPYSNENERERASIRDLPTGTITLLFSDIEESARLLQQLGERYAQVLSECRHLLRTVFQEYNGHEVETQGDAFFVAFARATDAVAAAVAAQHALVSHTFPEGAAVQVRIGLHTGEPELASEGYMGLDVHHTSQIMSAGHGGQVLLSQTTRELVEHTLPEGVLLRDLGKHRLKDLQRPNRLFQLVIAGLPADFPPLKTFDVYPNNLPLLPTPFIGREREVAGICQILRRREIRLLTLTGSGGVGKTRLGLQVAAELSDLFTHGIYFVNLAPLSDPDLVVPTVAWTLGLQERGEQSLLDLLQAFLRDKHVLLLLDNFEQVVSAAVQVAALLAACPRLKLVVTSRMALSVRAEHEYAVPPLTLPDLKRLHDAGALAQSEAVALFIQRAQAIQPTFQLTQANAPAIAEICIRLDGLPLAIELAAARIKLLPPRALLQRLSRRLEILTGGPRDLPSRQQTLRDTIQWSYDLLTVQEQRLFRRLSVFVGGCTLQAVEEVCATLDDGDVAGQVVDGVASLIDKSLVQQTELEGEESGLIVLETIREYALEALATSGELEATQQAHAEYYLALAERAEPQLDGTEQVSWLARLDHEHENLRAALTWLLDRAHVEGLSQAERALRFCAALHPFWWTRGYLREGWTFLEKALIVREGVATLVQARVLSAAARYGLSLLGVERAEALGKESLALYRERRDTAGIAATLFHLGRIARMRHQYATAQDLQQEALTLYKELNNTGDSSSCLTEIALVFDLQGEYSQALTLLKESLVQARTSGDRALIAWTLFCTAFVLLRSQADPAQVHPVIEESIALYRMLEDQYHIAYGLALLGELRLVQDEASLARELFEESLATFREMGAWWEMAEVQINGLARVYTVQGDLASARALYQASLAAAVERDDKYRIAACLEGMASSVAEEGEIDWATQLWGAAEALRESIGAPIPLIYRDDYEQAVALARSQASEETFATAWAEGRSIPLEQVLANSEPLPLSPPSRAVVLPPASPAGLTPREMDVLRLLAGGLTSAQIAEQLVISSRTVNGHLTSIYSKIGVSSRSAATRYAMEQHLV